MSSAAFQEVEHHNRLGEFSKALAALNGLGRDVRRGSEDEFDTWSAELLAITGDVGGAVNLAERAFRRSLDPALEARLRLTLATALFETGAFEQTSREVQRALSCATKANDLTLAARGQLALLSFFSDTGATDNLIPLIAATKRA